MAVFGGEGGDGEGREGVRDLHGGWVLEGVGVEGVGGSGGVGGGGGI